MHLPLIVSILICIINLTEAGISLKPFPNQKYYHPSNNLVVVYKNHRSKKFQSTSNDSNEYNPIVKLDIQSTIPSVNLDNLSGIKNVECSRGKLTIRMKSIEPLKSWNFENGTVILVDSHWKCYGQWFFTNSIRFIHQDEAEFNIIEINPKEFIDDFEISISHQENPDYQIEKKNFHLERGSAALMSKTPFEYRYRGQILKVMTQLPAGGVDIYCDPECVLQGSTALQMKVKGNGRAGFAKAVMETGIGASFDLKIGIILRNSDYLGSKQLSLEKELFKVALLPLQVIPGILNLGAFLHLDFNGIISPMRQGEIQFGFQFNHSLANYSLLSNSTQSILTKGPTSNDHLKTEFILLPSSFNNSISITGALQASLAVKAEASIFGVNLFSSTGITFDNGIASSVDIIGGSGRCASNEELINVAVYSRIKAAVGRLRKTLLTPFYKNLYKTCMPIPYTKSKQMHSRNRKA